MIFSIVVALMVILVTAFWVYQGFFSGAIMFFCTVVACLLAFGFYEQVHSLWAANLNAGIGLPLALMLIFIVTLLLLRLGTDKMIPNSVRLPIVVDRAGGGVCGLFTGLLLVGTALVGIQMLPIGSSVLGFERMTTAADGTAVQGGFMLRPDGFTVGLVNTLSSGSFQGESRFETAKPDFLMDLYAGRANPQLEDPVFIKDCLAVTEYWKTRQIDQVSQRAEGDALEREFTTVEPSGANDLLVCRVRVDASAAGADSTDIRFRVPQFRVVGPPPPADGTPSASPMVYLASGMSDLYTHKVHGLKSVSKEQASRLVRFGPQTDFILNCKTAQSVAELKGRGDGATCKSFTFDVAFEVPPEFTPWYVEFKRGSRAELTKKLLKEQPPADASAAFGSAAPKVEASSDDSAAEEEGEASADEDEAEKDDKPKVGKAPGGNVHVADAVEARTGVFDTLPVPVKKASPVTQNLQGDKLKECHFFVDLPDQPPTENAVMRFLVPEGKTMVQVGADKKDALSLFGRALNFATNVAAQIRITDSEDKDYYAIGVYSIAPVSGKMVLEIQYYPDSEQPERCLKKAKKLTENVLRSTDPNKRFFGYLFLVDPGVKIVSFSAGARNSAKQKLEISVPE